MPHHSPKITASPFPAGIAVCGVGVGGLLIPPLIRRFLEEYGWRGTVLLIAGLRLHLLIAAFLFRPLTKRMKKKGSNLVLKFDPGSRLNVSCHQPIEEIIRNESDDSLDEYNIKPNGSIRTIQVRYELVLKLYCICSIFLQAAVGTVTTPKTDPFLGSNALEEEVNPNKNDLT